MRAILPRVRPTYDDETLAGYFQPVHAATWDDPLVGPVLRRLAEDDPDLLAAVADVDRSQIRDCLQASPGDRLRTSLRMTATLTSFRRVG